MRDGYGRKLSEEEAAKITRKPAQEDARGQYAKSKAKPNKGGLVSANPVVLSGDGDATPGNDHGRDREIIDEP